MRALLSFALLAFPGEFRKTYGADLLLDLEHRKDERGYAFRIFFDVLLAGLGMRLELLRRDVSYASRMLVKAPLFTCAVGGTLAVAIAANAVILGALQAVVLAPLPYAHADRLFVSALLDSKSNNASEYTPPVPFVDTLAGSRTIEAAAAVQPIHGFESIDGHYINFDLAHVTANYFATLGVRPYIGRLFNARSEQSQAVISYAFWRTHYAANPHVVGKLLNIDGTAYTITGVAPDGMVDPGFGLATSEDAWTLFPRAGESWGLLVVRARPGSDIAAVRADLKRLWQNAVGKPWQSYPKWTQLFTQPVHDAILDDAQTLWIFFAAAAAVLLIASANIASLILARTRARRDEFAVRAALGASARRIATQSITETLVLCGFASLVGLTLAALCMRGAAALLPANLPRVGDARIDLHVVLYVCALGVAAAVVAGLVPALTAAGKHITGRRGTRAGMTFVTLEVGAAFALLVCAALLLRSFLTLTSQPLGFQPHHVYSAGFVPKNLFSGILTGRARRLNTSVLEPQVVRRLGALPGVTQTATALHVPLGDDLDIMTAFWLPGKPMPALRDNGALANIFFFSPDYVRLMRIPIIAGRIFTSADFQRRDVLVVNQAFARKYLGAPSAAVGARIYSGAGARNGGKLYRIIGVIGDTRDALSQPPKPTAFLPPAALRRGRIGASQVFMVVMKTKGDDPRLATEVAEIARKYFPQYAPPTVASLDQKVAADSAVARTSLAMLATLAAIALLLALAGIYGLVAFSVERRYHEIGIRLALGETRSRLFLRIVASSVSQALLGIALGVAASVFGVRAIEQQLFKTSPFDPATFTSTAALLIACVAVASALPAWRAIRIDPARTLRFE